MDQPARSQNFTWVGIILGMVFPIMAITADLLYEDLQFSLTNIGHLFSRGPLHWIILSAPLVLGAVFYFFTRVVRSREAVLLKDKKDNQDQVEKMEQFITAIEHGDFSRRTDSFSNTKLAALLDSLRNKLQHQKDDDEKARWIAEGHARFGETLRSTQDLSVLSDEMLKQLVKYLSMNQGSIFIVEEEDEEVALKLMSCYAYDRKKYQVKRVQPGDGLVGQCYLENDTIIMKEVPTEYIHITSGLGHATASFLVIIPIKTEDHTVGVLEMASFKALEPYQVEFIEKVCEGFASVIRSVQITEQTKKLLEETQSQTEQLRLQEEEIRQNMEEMQATQEELTRQLEEAKLLRQRVERRENVMGLTTILSETDLQGHITFVNDKFCEVSQFRRDELMDKPQSIVRHPDMPKELFRTLWSTIKQGKAFHGIIKNRKKDGGHYWVDATIVPIKDETGRVIKYVGSRYHIKDDRAGQMLYNEQALLNNWPLLQTLQTADN